MTKSDTGSELVFVYGTLRRGGSNAFRMEGAEFVGEGFVRGRLYTISWYPGLVLDEDAGMVRGEVFRAGPGLLRELDEFEGISAGEKEGGEYRRVETRVYLDGVPTNELVHAWAYHWIGSTEETKRIASGDWLAGDFWPASPYFSWISLICLVAFPAGLLVGISLEHSASHNDRAAGKFLAVGAGISPIIALSAAYLGHRRREKAALVRVLVFVFAGSLCFLGSIGVILLLLGIVK